MIHALGAGSVLGQLVDAEWRAAAIVLAAVVLAAAGAAAAVGPGRRRELAALAAFCAALAGAGWLTEAVERRPIAPAHVAATALPWRGALVGVVRGEPVRRARTTTLLVEAERLGSGANARAVYGRVRLTLRRPRALRDGDRVRLWVTLRAPRSFRSPGAFDFTGYLARRGVYMTGSVWDEPAPERLEHALSGGPGALARWRRAARRALADGVAGRERAVLAALVLGSGETLPEALRERFRQAGALHVLVVSGLHLTLVAAMAVRIGEALLLRSERLALSVDVPRLARLLSLVPVAAYLALVGPSVSAVRAVVATTVAALAVALGRDASPWRSWSLALVITGCLWPGCVREAGCQLSFAAVAGVLLARRPAAASFGARLAAVLRIAATVTVVTAPVMALHFDALAPIGVVANPIVVPLFGAAVLGPGLLAAALAPWWHDGAAALFRVAAWLVWPGVTATTLLGGPLAVPLPVPRPSGPEVALCYGLLALRYAAPGPWRARAAAGMVLLLAVDAGWWAWERHAPGRLRVAFLDVGQGDAAVVELPDGRVVVVDGGGFPGSELDPGRAVVEPYLRSRKIARIDVLAMSHAHPDHAGGLPRLIERFRPREFWWAGTGGEGPAWQAVSAALERHRVTVRALRRGDVPLAGPGATLVTVLHPPRRWVPAAGLNDSSLVLRLQSRGIGVLFTGDVERYGEALLAAGAAALAPAADVLKVPHHGSRTSSTPAWLARVAPRVAVISVGGANVYGLPAPDVVARYRAAGACLVRTDRCGTIELEERRVGFDVRAAVDVPACRCRFGARRPAPGRSGRGAEAVAQREHHEPDAVAHPELLEDVGEVRLDGPLADAQRLAHFPVLVARGHQPHDLELAFGEPVVLARGGVLDARVDRSEVAAQHGRHARVDPALAGADRPNRLHERVAGRVLEDDTARAQPEGAQMLFLLVTGGEHQDARAGMDA
ncbi:MAG TPA: ComEC/Rec2 family competence protein [Candidatus Limnocylindria bacterium]|nr:ComEC/Rec2 family competence protein [Candidatus Limnocylindria bacterium]